MDNFTGNGNTYAVRAENILMDGEAECKLEAQVVEKSYAGGQLRILFRLNDGQMITANRYGIEGTGISIASAAEMLNNVVGMLLVIGANTISRKASNVSLY